MHTSLLAAAFSFFVLFFLMASQATHFQDIDVLVPVVPTTNWIGPASDLRFLGLGKGGEVQRTTHTPYLVSVC